MLPSTCVDESKYVFWDSYHPTERAYEILVGLVLNKYIHTFFWILYIVPLVFLNNKSTIHACMIQINLLYHVTILIHQYNIWLINIFFFWFFWSEMKFIHSSLLNDSALFAILNALLWLHLHISPSQSFVVISTHDPCILIGYWAHSPKRTKKLGYNKRMSHLRD